LKLFVDMRLTEASREYKFHNLWTDGSKVMGV
jgi:hypothetical protein